MTRAALEQIAALGAEASSWQTSVRMTEIAEAALAVPDYETLANKAREKS